LLASTDAVARRLPRPIVNGLAAALAVTLTATCAAHGDWEPSLRAAQSGAAVALLAGGLWWAKPGACAFGDVKVVVLASAAAAAVSWQSIVAMLLLGCIAGAVYATCIRWSRRSALGWDGTLPFVPGLALGFVAGVVLW